MIAARVILYTAIGLAAGLVGWLVFSALASLLAVATTTLEGDPYTLRARPGAYFAPTHTSTATRCKPPVRISPTRTVVRCSPVRVGS